MQKCFTSPAEKFEFRQSVFAQSQLQGENADADIVV